MLKFVSLQMRTFLVFICALVSLSIVAARPASVAQKRAPSLCKANEQIFFNCTVKGGKIISLCASKQLTAKTGYLQYRFGKIGAPELQFPEKLEGSQSAFRFDHYFRARVDRSDIVFKNAGYEYTVFDDWEGDVKPEIRQSGVSVVSLTNEKDTSQLDCRGPRVTRLVALDEIVPPIEDSKLNPPDQ